MLGIALAAASGVFVWYLYLSKLIPLNYLIIGSVAFALLTALVVWLGFNLERTWRSLVGCTLALAIVSGQTYVVDFIKKGTETLEVITNVQVEYAEVGVYVKADDPATDINDLKDYSFGILKSIDRGITDVAVSNIINLLGDEISVFEYETIDESAEALLDIGEINAIIVNKAFIEILVEIEGFEDALEKMKEVYLFDVESTVVLPTDTSSSSGGGGGGSYAEGPLETGTYVEPDPSTKMPEHVFSVYISGIDCYGTISRRSRSDVNILAVVNTKTNQVLLISTPRDFYVQTPVSGNTCDKLTNAGIYGVKVSRGALEMLYDAEINYSFRVNFTGFEQIIDALGGITVYSKYAFTTKYGDSYVKGDNEVDGKKALTFARERYSFASGDRQRGKNQMEVIKGVINKMTSLNMLTNYKEVLDSVASSMETDISYDFITTLIQNQLSSGTKWNITTYSVDGTGASKKPYSQKGRSYVMIPKQSTIDKAKSLIDQIISDEIPTT